MLNTAAIPDFPTICFIALGVILAVPPTLLFMASVTKALYAWLLIKMNQVRQIEKSYSEFDLGI